MTAARQPPAPIIVFAYRRPGHLRRAIDALRANPLAADSALVVACDGPKGAADAAPCAAVQAYARSLGEGFASVEVWPSERNRGLAESVVTGVSAILERHGRVIVVEDDLEVSPHFLRFMNDGLDCYDGDDKVASVHGYCWPVDAPLPETFFLRGADCWGWATWRRAWRVFEPDGQVLRDRLRQRGLTARFDFDGALPFSRMLEAQIAGRNDSWAVRWHASCFLADMLTVYPGHSLVRNIGNDGSGTHAEATKAYDARVAERPIEVRRQPVLESEAVRQRIVAHLRRRHGSAWARWKALVRAKLARAVQVSA